MDYYDRGGIEGAPTDLKGRIGLSDSEKTDLVAFLESLSSTSLAGEVTEVGIKLAPSSQTAGRPATGDPSARAVQKIYLLDCPADESVWNLPPKGLHWKKLHKMFDEKAGQLIKVADRDQVDQSLYLDIEGLRLYVSSRECLKTLKELPAESSQRITSGYVIRNLLGRRYAEKGIEPDRIPVRGPAGKKLGTSGMVLIKGGEYVRPGH